VFYTAPALQFGADISALADDMHAGRVRAVFMLDSNPAYATPAALGFAEALARVPMKLHAGSHLDETAIRADWHLPLKHPLESWGDPRALDGTVTLMQPAISPLYEGRSVAEILSLLSDPEPHDDVSILRAGWDADAPTWQTWLLDGFIPHTALPEESVTPLPAAPAPAAASGLRVLFRPDPTVWDGGPANNGWLQELPKPLTKLTWENAIAIAPALAAREKLVTGDIATLQLGGRSVQGPVWVLPGQAEDAVTITLGYGRQAGGAVAEGLGFDAFQIMPAATRWEATGATLHAADAHRELATTQEHHAIDGADLVRVQAIGAAAVGDAAAPDPPDFTPRLETDGRSWGMVIDIDACIGCNACVVACQAENNSPVVGRDQVLQGRDMHWLRIDRYAAEPAPDSARSHFMPVPCMHCETAPCEMGCPVEATLHDHEGLNLQVYNRCIGTRACSSDCPYKVRHFNYLDYTADLPPSIEAQQNPDVTVRARGVMEKCTYCVQRIVQARITADRDNAPIPDGSVQTACQQGCPTRAITFGDLARADSAVAAARRDGRNYALLGELNTRPHTTYLAALAAPPAAKG
jgi:molybdopterin-containing oxidoreductase family iron-sulfur binding subunit